MLYVLIPAKWLTESRPELKSIQGEFELDFVKELNAQGYNVFHYPNHPSQLTYDNIPENKEGDGKRFVQGKDVDVFNYVFVDMDLKEGVYKSKEDFLAKLAEFSLVPSKIVDSGNGIHAYWHVVDLNAMDFLKLSRRAMRYFNTDPAVAQIKQLMRLPGTLNTKNKDSYVLCQELLSTQEAYTCEQLDASLPPLTPEDEDYCKNHYQKTYNPEELLQKIDTKIPVKFSKLIQDNTEVKSIWGGEVKDRSAADFRLGHIMFAHGFTKEEATSVLVNSPKALSRGPTHRISYAQGIVDKIFLYEQAPKTVKKTLSKSVTQILNEYEGDEVKGVRFPCWSYFDNTECGFRLGHVIGLVAGSGVGKTAVALDMFKGFAKNNPNYDHFFVSLELPAREIADRWHSICKEEPWLYDKVHIIDNYNDDGTFRNLSLDDIKDYIKQFQKDNERKIGCVVIDHIACLKRQTAKGENQDLIDICHAMKPFALETNTLLVMQSQAPREKAGIGDLELNKDAAYGTTMFESYCDYLITIWQPLKRCYAEKGCPTVTAYKFCKIRHKKQTVDKILEDVCYRLFFDPNTNKFRRLTQIEEKSFDYFASICSNLRSQDRKTGVVKYNSISVDGEVADGNPELDSDQDIIGPKTFN